MFVLNPRVVEPEPDLIKMDVEGAEPDLLLGAKNTIRRYRPKLMISAYHQADHLFEIPELIRAMVPDYKLYVRNHSWANLTDSWPGSFSVRAGAWPRSPKCRGWISTARSPRAGMPMRPPVCERWRSFTPTST